jgi:hypothetical protein
VGSTSAHIIFSLCVKEMTRVCVVWNRTVLVDTTVEEEETSLVRFDRLVPFDFRQPNIIHVLAKGDAFEITIDSAGQLYRVYSNEDYHISCVSHEADNYFAFIDVVTVQSSYYFKSLFLVRRPE